MWRRDAASPRVPCNGPCWKVWTETNLDASGRECLSTGEGILIQLWNRPYFEQVGWETSILWFVRPVTLQPIHGCAVKLYVPWHELKINGEFSMGCSCSWQHWQCMKCPEYSKILKTSLQFTAVPVLGFPSTHANTFLPALVKCGGIYWNSLEPEFKALKPALQPMFSVLLTLFLQNTRSSKCFCLFCFWTAHLWRGQPAVDTPRLWESGTLRGEWASMLWGRTWLGRGKYQWEMQCWRCHRIILLICKGKRCLSMRCQGNENQAGKVCGGVVLVQQGAAPLLSPGLWHSHPWYPMKMLVLCLVSSHYPCTIRTHPLQLPLHLCIPLSDRGVRNVTWILPFANLSMVLRSQMGMRYLHSSFPGWCFW